MRKLIASFCLGLAAWGCNNNILAPRDPALLSPNVNYINGTPNPWNLYQDDFLHNAWFQGLAVWDAYTMVSVDPACTANPLNGARCLKIRYENNLCCGASWAEMVLIHSPDFTGFTPTPGRDLSGGGYTKCTFWMRTSQAATVGVQAALEGGGGVTNEACTTSWQKFTLALPANLSAIKTFFMVTTPSVLPLDIYIDDLRYEK